MNEDNEQNIILAEVKKDIHYLKKAMERNESRISDMIRSFNKQAENWKMYCDETFITKKDGDPVIDLFEKGKNKLASLGLVIIILLGMIGLATTGVLHSIKDKLLR